MFNAYYSGKSKGISASASAATVVKESVGDLDRFLQQACHSSLRASVNHTHILEMGKGGELMRLRKMQVCEGRILCYVVQNSHQSKIQSHALTHLQ